MPASAAVSAGVQSVVRPPYDPELGALLDASPLPAVVTAEMITALRAAPFTAPIEEVLATRALDHQVRAVPCRAGDRW